MTTSSPCDRCNYAATSTSLLKTRIKCKHKEVKYPWDKCKFQEEGIKVEECELKKKMVYIKDKVITHTVEDTCTVYVQGEDVKMENIGIQSNNLI